MQRPWTLSRACLVIVAVLCPTHPLVATPQSVASPEATRGNPWDQFNYAPLGRTLSPATITHSRREVASNEGLARYPLRLAHRGDALIADFGQEVAGILALHFTAASSAHESLGLAFTESSLYLGEESDLSNGGTPEDGALSVPVTGAGDYVMPIDKLRGGFRYVTLFLQTSGWVEIDGIELTFTAAPMMPSPRRYANYFYSSDDLLNRIWYAGAYTVQLNTIDPTQGRAWPAPPSGWDNGATVGVGESVLVDGAKRDRTVWPGDLYIASLSAFVSTNDVISTRNSLFTLFQRQLDTGELPYAGPEVDLYNSDTYHMWTLLAAAELYRHSGNADWLAMVWPRYKTAVAFITQKINGRGLLEVTGKNDWARKGQGGENIAANAMAYRLLIVSESLARATGEDALAQQYSDLAVKLKAAANDVLWDAPANLYRDNPTSTLHPQDGNSLAVWFQLVDSATRARSISEALIANWNQFGATTPEKDGNIATFPGSMEVHAHFVAGEDQRAVDLIKREWGYMLDSPIGTHSTFWEGYRADGSFDYFGSYMSHAHGWATGPTSALTLHLLGLAPSPDGCRVLFMPHPADLRFAQGRLTTPCGAITAAWQHHLELGEFHMQWEAPAATSVTIAVPTFGQTIEVRLNDRLVWDGGRDLARGARSDGRYVYLAGPTGGWHVVSSRRSAVPR